MTPPLCPRCHAPKIRCEEPLQHLWYCRACVKAADDAWQAAQEVNRVAGGEAVRRKHGERQSDAR
jgi:ribosomal protein L37AE/L43A